MKLTLQVVVQQGDEPLRVQEIAILFGPDPTCVSPATGSGSVYCLCVASALAKASCVLNSEKGSTPAG